MRRAGVLAHAEARRVKLYLYDDARARGFEPFALTRPIATLVAGTSPTWARWAAFSAEAPPCLCAPHLESFDGIAVVDDTVTLDAGSVVANSRFIPSLRSAADIESLLETPSVAWTNDRRVVAARLATDTPASAFADGQLTLESLVGPTAQTTDIDGWWHDEVWDYVRNLPEQLDDDIFAAFESEHGDWIAGSRPFAQPPVHATVLGQNPILIAADDPNGEHARAVVIEPHVVLDATAGPILIDSGAHIRSFTRLVGPCAVGAESTILSGEVTACSIGPHCKVRGDMSASIILGYSNKGHEGFVGHSYLGEWVNLGAGTTTSNLKNTYGPVALWTPHGLRDTGLQFLGSMFGDHVKTGIGTTLTTGTVIGAGANVFGGTMAPKVVPPFAWGSGTPFDTYELEKFLRSAERMMSRRDVTLSDGMVGVLGAAFERRWSP